MHFCLIQVLIFEIPILLYLLDAVDCSINMHLWKKKPIPDFEIICLDLYIFFFRLPIFINVESSPAPCRGKVLRPRPDSELLCS